MDIKDLFAALAGALVVIGIMGAFIYALVRKDLENLRNIPDKEWFDDVKKSLNKITTLENSDKFYLDRITLLEARMLVQEQRKL